MTFPGEALLTAGAGAAMSYYGTQKANKATRKLVHEQMDFQERMSNTAYQRSMQDLRSAGVNPIFAFGSGGASSPGGASATMQNELAGAASSAMDYSRLKAELDNMQASKQKIQSETTINEIEAMLLKTKLPGSKADAILGEAKTDIVEAILNKRRGGQSRTWTDRLKFWELLK